MPFIYQVAYYSTKSDDCNVITLGGLVYCKGLLKTESETL